MRTGVSTRSLRYYEEQGLLTAERTGGGHREYDQSAVDRVRRIQELFRAGMRSPMIKKILPCIRDEDGRPSAVADSQLAVDLDHERTRIQQQIVDLQTSLDSLDQVIETAALPEEQDN